MKLSLIHYVYVLRDRIGYQNFKFLTRFLVAILIIITIDTILFHVIMAREGQVHTWFTGVYWTLTVMSTLGFGDITFTSDLGRLFSMTVLITGMLLLLILLPFTFIEFVYEPLMRAQSAARAPRFLPPDIEDHVVMTNYDEVTLNLITRLDQHHYDYVIIVEDLAEALELHDEGYRVMLGSIDDPETYVRARVKDAALVAATSKDTVNTSVAFTARDISEHVPIITTANSPDSVDILELAGSTQVLQLGEMMGQFLARLATGGDAMTHVIGQFDELFFAEANVTGTPLLNKTLLECKVRELTGVTVVGIWRRGKFEMAQANTMIGENMVLVIMGTEEQLSLYDELFAIYHASEAPIVIIGSGRVGRAAAKTLEERNIPYCIIEQQADRVRDTNHYVLGNAADLDTLKKAGIMESPSVIITSHEDDINIYLTLYCRRLRPDIQIISRAKLERNVEPLHRAGADFVMSYASMGGNTLFNLLKRTDILMISEGLDLLRIKLPVSLAGKTIAETAVHQDTACFITAVYANQQMYVNPDASMRLPAESEIILIGTIDAEQKFLELYGD